MDRRTAFSSLLGLAGAGATLHWSRIGLDFGAAKSKVAMAQPPLRKRGSGNISSVSLAQVPIGGGGFVTGIDLSSDGQRFVCRTDVANAYVRDANERAWLPLFSPLTMSPSDYDPFPGTAGKADGQGVAGIRIAPSNRDIIFASYYGFIWRSMDGGKTIKRTRLSQKTMLSNAGWQRLFNRTIDIHPRDPRIVAVGTWGDGVWFTIDGGDRWDQIKLPESGKSRDGQPGIYLVCFDPTAESRIYVFVTGVGMYRSDTGPTGDFRAIPGGPTLCSNIVIGPGGIVYLCEQTMQGSGGRLFHYSPDNGWASGKPDYEVLVIAVDPSKPTRLVGSNPDGLFVESLDGGRSFRTLYQAEWESRGEVGWTRRLKSLFPAQMLIDPNATNRLWVAQGVGIAEVNTAGSKYLAQDWSAGIEELCAVGILCVPGGKTFLSALDKPFWRIDDLTAYTNDFLYPVRPGKSHNSSFVAPSSYMDFAGDDPRFLVGIVAPSEDSAPGFSSDGGDSWQAFESTPVSGWGYGGCIASSTKKNILLLPSNNGVGVFTIDGGLSWSPIKLDGINPTGRFSNAYYVKRKNISADKSRPGTFALVYTVYRKDALGNDAYGNPLGGVWVTRNGGLDWDQVLSGVVSAGEHHDPMAVRMDGQDDRQFWDCQLDYVPGASGELLYTAHADKLADRFLWSRDDGKSWNELHKKIRNVRAFGFGKSRVGQSRPSVYFWGEVDGKPGLYVSLDWFATVPEILSRFPSQMIASISVVAGDPDRFGRAYIGTSCAGLIRVDVET